MLEKATWLMERLRTPVTMRKLQEEWKYDPMNNFPGRPFDKKTFENWKNYLDSYLGIEVEMSQFAGRNTRYWLKTAPGAGSARKWLINTVSIQNTLRENLSIRDRILLEDIPSSEDALKLILDAVKQNRLISFDYEDYWEDPIPVTMQPYFVKLYRQHWKVIGPLQDGKIDSIRSYALDADRMKNLRVLDEKFCYPEGFSPEKFMADSFGTATFPIRAAEPMDVIILAWEKVNLYLKHTPLHGSQRILYDCPEDGYTIFGYHLHTTDDFYQEICRYGNYMEVLYPSDVREEMMKIIKGMSDEYAGVSRKDCKKRVPGVKELKALMKGAEEQELQQ